MTLEPELVSRDHFSEELEGLFFDVFVKVIEDRLGSDITRTLSLDAFDVVHGYGGDGIRYMNIVRSTGSTRTVEWDGSLRDAIMEVALAADDYAEWLQTRGDTAWSPRQ